MKTSGRRAIGIALRRVNQSLRRGEKYMYDGKRIYCLISGKWMDATLQDVMVSEKVKVGVSY
jgi:hypothetical protein